MNVQYAFQKAMGGSSKVIQDHGFAWSDEETNRYVFGVADGHGKSHGRFISASLTEFMVSTIQANKADLSQANIVPFITRLFDCAEVFLRKAILKRLEEKDFEIKTMELTEQIFWRKPETRLWNVLEGGTTIAMTFILGDWIVTANTGNCYSTLISLDPVLEKHDFGIMFDVARPSQYTFTAKSNATTKSINLTQDHSPICQEEYVRMMLSHYKPKLVYDEIDDLPFKPISFEQEEKDHKGNYYRNKEKEFASVVLIENGPYGLSSTRSFLNTSFKRFGVTHKPVITKVDMEAVWQRCNGENASGLFALVLGTNGIFDNWIRSYEKAEEVETSDSYVLGEFIFHETCVDALYKDGSGASKILNAFMERNTIFAKRNFGEDGYDESAGILVFFSKKDFKAIPSTAFEYEKSVYIKVEDEEKEDTDNEDVFEADLYEVDVTNISKLAF